MSCGFPLRGPNQYPLALDRDSVTDQSRDSTQVQLGGARVIWAHLQGMGEGGALTEAE